MPPPAALPAGSDAQNGHLRGLILQKEKELHDINEYRIHTLESLVSDKEKDITEHKQRLQKMKDDFCFNLKLIATAELQHSGKQERERAAEAESYYQQKVAQLREEGEAARWKRDDELRTQRDEFESLKRDFVRQVRELQDTLTSGGSDAPAASAASSSSSWRYCSAWTLARTPRRWRRAPKQ